MIRTFIIPNQSNYKVTLVFPDDYLGEEVEIIAFKKQEGLPEKDSGVKTVSFEALSIDTKNFKFNRNDANER